MGRIKPRDSGIHGDTPVTSQAQADISCKLFNYFIQGFNLQEVTAQPLAVNFVGTDTVNRLALNEVTSQPALTTSLS